MPNVIIAFRVSKGGYLRKHFNEKRAGLSPYVSIWTFGNKVQYYITTPKPIPHPNDPELKINEVTFTFNSFDWIIMNGVKCKHGYKQCKFSSEIASENEIKYRIAICAFQIDDISRFKEYFPDYFWNGKNSDEAKDFDGKFKKQPFH